jgi:hypothetical protein
MNRLGRELVSLYALMSVGCAGATSDNSPAPPFELGADHPQVTSAAQAIVNGMPLGLPDEQHGIVSLWQRQPFTTTGEEIDEWRQACTATLLTNTMALSARHCFTSQWLESGAVWGSLNGTFHYFNWRVDSSDLDASVLITDDPFELDGSTTGYARPLLDAEAGQSAMAGGYGYNNTAQGRPGHSDLCGSGYMGCPQDPLPLLVSSHTTFWDAGERTRELGVATNDKGQTPAEGDSGSGLFLELVTRFLDWPLLGVTSRQYRPDPDNNPELWNTQYVPIQELRGFLCDNGFGC